MVNKVNLKTYEKSNKELNTLIEKNHKYYKGKEKEKDGKRAPQEMQISDNEDSKSVSSVN